MANGGEEPNAQVESTPQPTASESTSAPQQAPPPSSPPVQPEPSAPKGRLPRRAAGSRSVSRAPSVPPPTAPPPDPTPLMEEDNAPTPGPSTTTARKVSPLNTSQLMSASKASSGSRSAAHGHGHRRRLCCSDTHVLSTITYPRDSAQRSWPLDGIQSARFYGHGHSSQPTAEPSQLCIPVAEPPI